MRRQLMAPDHVAEFVRAFNEETNRLRREREARREQLTRDAKDIVRKIDTLLDAFASGALKGENALGESLPMIGKLLGHTQVQTTARYAHLAADPVKAAERVSVSIANLMDRRVSQAPLIDRRSA
ncbi:MAG TPA: hypothetical protein VNL39_05040 [Xanthobacteraceae bacterium]|nr:hypothetical protein [Xanthobacteraceae bacterium]